MKKIASFSAFIALVLLQSCVGTDFIDDPIIPERVIIAPRISTLDVGKEQTFTIKYTNKYGVEETPKSIVWRSNATDKVTIDAMGKAKTVATGKVMIYATVGTVSDSILLNQSTTGGGGGGTANDTTFLRRGTFQTISSSYPASGNIRIQTVKGVTQIVTEANFNASPGPSVYLLLANHTNGSYAVTPGANATNAVSVQITPNKLTKFSGVQTWDVPASAVPANYKYAVLYCVLGPVFGAAELK